MCPGQVSAAFWTRSNMGSVRFAGVAYFFASTTCERRELVLDLPIKIRGRH